MADLETFEWLTKQTVRNSRGFEFGTAGRFAMEYREGERSMLLPGEHMFSGLEGASWGFIFDGWHAVRWQPPHDWDDITDENRAQIKANVIRAIGFMDGKAKFI